MPNRYPILCTARLPAGVSFGDVLDWIGSHVAVLGFDP